MATTTRKPKADQPKPELCPHDLDPATCAECNGSAQAERDKQPEPEPQPEPSQPTAALSMSRYPYWLLRAQITGPDGTPHLPASGPPRDRQERDEVRPRPRRRGRPDHPRRGCLMGRWWARRARHGMSILHTASYRAWAPGLGTPVRTSLGTPKGIAGAAEWPRCWPITPRSHYLRASAEVYAAAYLAQLERYGARPIAQELASITRETGAETLLLMCFEADRERCHRSLLAVWWLEATGERITEIGERS